MVVRADRVLLVQRGREPDRGKWGFPGGLVELGETVAAAALRELAEETGIKAEAGPVVEMLEVITPDDSGRIRYHFILTALACHWRSGDGEAGDDAAATGWFTLDDIIGGALPCSRDVGRLARIVLATTATAMAPTKVW
jgi:ADP-ribose pyrophosphatase YjhB (NUDIX family)